MLVYWICENMNAQVALPLYLSILYTFTSLTPPQIKTKFWTTKRCTLVPYCFWVKTTVWIYSFVVTVPSQKLNEPCDFSERMLNPVWVGPYSSMIPKGTQNPVDVMKRRIRSRSDGQDSDTSEMTSNITWRPRNGPHPIDGGILKKKIKRKKEETQCTGTNVVYILQYQNDFRWIKIYCFCFIITLGSCRSWQTFWCLDCICFLYYFLSLF